MNMIKEFMISNPRISIIALAILVTFIMTLITKYTTNQNRMKELKKIQKECQIKLKDNKGNPEKISEINKQVMECSMELMKHSFKPLFFTFIPLIILIWWIKDIYTTTEIAKTWIWWYIGAGLISSPIIRKILKVT